MTNKLVYIFAALILLSCKKENATDCFKSNGDMASEYRSTAFFNEIKVYDKIDLNVYQGQEFNVEVQAGENLFRNIKTTVDGNILTIKNLNKCNFVRGYKKRITVTVTLPHLNKVNNEGVGTVKIRNLIQDSVFIRAENSGDIHVDGVFKKVITSSHGNGDIYLSGSCDSLYSYLFGTNFLKAQDFHVNKYIFIETISIGDATIRAPDNGKLECNIWRSGNVYYTGNPSVIRNLSDGSGKGRLIQR